MKWFLKKTGHAGLNNLLHAYDDKTASVQMRNVKCPNLTAP